jgi:hypothetical protein
MFFASAPTIISAAVPAVAGNMGADEARGFVVGNLFSFTCFEGTTGERRPCQCRRFRRRRDPLGRQRVATIRDTSARNAAGQGRRHLRANKRAAVRGLFRSRSHRSEELPRFGRGNEPARVLPLHQTIYSGRHEQHLAATPHPTDCHTFTPVMSLRPVAFNPLVTILKLRESRHAARYIWACPTSLCSNTW